MKTITCLLGAMLLVPAVATAAKVKLVKDGAQFVGYGQPDGNGYRATVRFQKLTATFPNGTQRTVLVRDPYQGQNPTVTRTKRSHDARHVLGMQAKGGRYTVRPTGMERKAIAKLLAVRPDVEQVTVFGWLPQGGKRLVSLDIHNKEGVLVDRAATSIDLKSGQVGTIKIQEKLPTWSNRTK